MSNDVVEEDTAGTGPLAGIAFLTGENPSAGSFLLVVGLVTCVFVAAFQFTLPEPISTILTALVLVVAVISSLMGAILDALGHFDVPDAET
jgi:hypothetical protein